MFKDNNKNYRLKITASPDGDIRYYFKKPKIWKQISKENYLNFISNIPFFHIEGNMVKNCSNTLSCIFNSLTINDEELNKVIVDHIYETYRKLDEGYKNPEIYRNLLFEFLKIVTELSIEINRSLLKNTIILFEDPELYLHPQKQRELYNCFIKLSKLGTKIYLKTYSSCFLGLKQYKSICTVKKRGIMYSLIK